MKLLTSIQYNWLIIKNRYKTKSPAFFIQLKKIAIKLVVGCAAVLAVNTSLSLGLPAALITVLGYIIAVGVGVFGTSILTKE